MLHVRKKMVPHILPNCSTTIPNKSGDDSGRELTSPRHRRGSGEPGDKYVHQKHNGSHAILDNTIETLRTASGNSLSNGSAPLEEEEIVSDTEPLLQQQHREASRKLEGDFDDGPEFEFRSPPPETEETALTIALQVFVPYLIAGFGTVGAGLVLDVVQHWEVFAKVSEVFILVPALLGLKGNLEMTLASRLSTQANLGNMDKASEQWKMIGGNLALTQAQAIIVGFLAAIAAMVMGWIPEGKFSLSHALLLSASSALTASLASLVLGIVMIGVVMLSRKCGINPDNVATPIAASLGDLTTLTFLASISMVLFKAIGQQVWLSPLVVSLCLVVTPVWLVVAYRNKYTHEVVYTGWTPIICAMVISR
ncbi:solute carrier family 41 member 1-like [Lingula anatina]|uniref:Solute carrier family 41 member 1-like n=1 Tax=Lingula anatina TaxID=7574 RepID=A0A1S3IXD8_LINAN|nr:solute carrier family 41 member 1-like [Lingula anatina]|eukprot:XP_013402641.2 solute carrier family 41 member 1-like [Lingula anatina]